jgi:CheB methylesterase
VEQAIGPRNFAVVAVGASYGGVEAMQKLFADLPATIPAAIFTVLHIGPHASQFPELLNFTRKRVKIFHVLSRLPGRRCAQKRGKVPAFGGVRYRRQPNVRTPGVAGFFPQCAH